MKQIVGALIMLIVGVSLFAYIRVGHLRSATVRARAHTEESLRAATVLLTTSDPERTAEERLMSTRTLLEQGAISLAGAASASREYTRLAESSFPPLRGITRLLEPPAATPASLSSSVTALSLRVSWRVQALAALRKLKEYDATADIGTLTARQNTAELIRRLYHAKDGMTRVADAIAKPPFAEESDAVLGTQAALRATRGYIDPLIVTLDTGRTDEAQVQLERFRTSSVDARAAAERAFNALSADGSLAAMVSDLSR